MGTNLSDEEEDLAQMDHDAGKDNFDDDDDSVEHEYSVQDNLQVRDVLDIISRIVSYDNNSVVIVEDEQELENADPLGGDNLK